MSGKGKSRAPKKEEEEQDMDPRLHCRYMKESQQRPLASHGNINREDYYQKMEEIERNLIWDYSWHTRKRSMEFPEHPNNRQQYQRQQLFTNQKAPELLVTSQYPQQNLRSNLDHGPHLFPLQNDQRRCNHSDPLWLLQMPLNYSKQNNIEMKKSERPGQVDEPPEQEVQKKPVQPEKQVEPVTIDLAHITQNSIDMSDKLKQIVERTRFLVPSYFFPTTMTKKSFHKRYQRVKTSTQEKFCIEWSKSSLSPVFPSKKVLQRSHEVLLSQGRKSSRWRAPILFSCNNTYHSTLILCKSVRIPYSHEPGHGNSCVYLSLPKSLGKKLKKTPSEYPNLETRDMDLYAHEDAKEWWKMAKDVDGLFGIVNELGNFEPKSLETIFKKTKRGITADLLLKLHCEAIAETSKQLKRRFVNTIKVEIVQGNIKEIGQDVYPPFGPRTILQAAGFEKDESLLFQLQMFEI